MRVQGRAFGAKVQKVQKVQRGGLTGLRPEGWGRLLAAGGVEGWRRERFLGLTGRTAGGFVSLTAFQAEGCGIALRAMSIKSALRDWRYRSYGMIRIPVIDSLRLPPKGGNCGMVHEIYDSLFFLSILLVSP